MTINSHNIQQWSDGYFFVDDDGDIRVTAKHSPQCSKKLVDIVHYLNQQDWSLPLLLRFNSILRERFDEIYHAFSQAIHDFNYQNQYTCVYPIKVNQQHSVVKTLTQHGQHRFGMEAGSKAELLAILGTPMPNNSFVICNGYKDKEYIRTALIGQQMGRRVFIVVEKLNELKMILEEAQHMQVVPQLGVRIRIYAISKGKWQDTGGEKSKFGLSPSQLLKFINQLQETGYTNSLKLLHCHLGSQISTISDIRRGIKECGRYYTELCRMGVPIDVLDVGGGLGVDYEGTQSSSYCSTNYSMQEYANTIIQTLSEIISTNQLDFPEIVTESGRALTAHHAVLITNIIDQEQPPGLLEPKAANERDAHIIQNLWHHYLSLNSETAIEAYHSASFYLNEAVMLYTHEKINLQELARCEQLYFAICRKVLPLLSSEISGHIKIINELNFKLANKLFCNFSLFQSLPDVWGVDQIFPIMPLQHLNKPLSHRGIVKDITCDSDGRIESYINQKDVETSLMIPEYSESNSPLLGIFMVGAYQEILGDLHNLFGDTHAIDIELEKEGAFISHKCTQGDKVSDVLEIVHFNTDDLIQQYYQQLSKSQLNKNIQKQYLEELKTGLHGYTYLED